MDTPERVALLAACCCSHGVIFPLAGDIWPSRLRADPHGGSFFTKSLTAPTGFGLLTASSQGFLQIGQRAARSLPERWPAVPTREDVDICGTRPSTRAAKGRGSLTAAPFYSGARMDVKTRNLALLAAVSLFLAGTAWGEDRAVFASVFFALGVVAIGGAAWRHWP
jgi:hypothetical protein